METLAFIVALTLVAIGWYYKKYHEMYTLSMKIPGPPAYPLIGNALMLARKSPSQLFKYLEEAVQQYGSAARIMIGPQCLVCLSDPRDVEMILGSQKLLEKSDEYNFLEKWLGQGLLLSSGQKWFARRKVISSTFHFKILEQFVEVFDKHSEIFTKNLAKLKGHEFDIFPLVALCALDIICGKF